MIVDRYYYGRLNDDEKTMYEEIYDGCKKHLEYIKLSASLDTMKKIYQRAINALVLDNPLLYCVNQASIGFAKDSSDVLYAKPKYLYTQEQITKYDRLIQDTVNRIIDEWGMIEGTDIEKVRKVHDYLAGNVVYAYPQSNAEDQNDKEQASSLIGALLFFSGNSESIAKTTKVILNAIDERCIIVDGSMNNSSGVTYKHDWNIVNIEGKPYHLDVSLDLNNRNNGWISYDYFNVSTSQIKGNHNYAGGLPECVSIDENYFVLNALEFSELDLLKDYIRTELKNGRRILYFKLSDAYQIKSHYKSLLEDGAKVLQTIGWKKVQAVRMINEAMNTCRIEYKQS